MGHYAKIENGIVVDVIVAGEDFIANAEGTYKQWFKDANGEADKFYNAPKIGDSYDYINQAYMEKQPYPSWALDENYKWQPPISKPDDTETHLHIWNENDGVWIALPIE